MYVGYTDGGKNETGYGSFAIFLDEELLLDDHYILKDARTSHEAEYGSLIQLLKKLSEYSYNEKVVIFADDKTIVMQLNGYWKVRAQNLLPYYYRAKSLMSKFEDIEIGWTPRETMVELFGH